MVRPAIYYFPTPNFGWFVTLKSLVSVCTLCISKNLSTPKIVDVTVHGFYVLVSTEVTTNA